MEQKKEIKIVEQEEAYDSEKIFSVLEETDNIREQIKNNQSIFAVNDQHEAFLQSFSQLNSIFSKEYSENKVKEEENVVNSEKLKDELA